MHTLNLETLSSDQRDQMLLQLLAEKADLSSNTSPTPVSDAGKAILQRVTEQLLSDVGDGRIDEAISQTTHSIDAVFEEVLWNLLAEKFFELGDYVEKEFTLGIVDSLAETVLELEEGAEGDTEAELLGDVTLTLCSYKENAAFIEMVANIRCMLPQLLENSVSFKIDTNEMRDVVKMLIHDFVMGQVIPDVARNICDTEVCLEPTPTSVLGIDADEATLDGLDEEGGCDHG